ncbi:PBAN-type neuropeptides-like [Danaus plexippus]|uniref:PBAN-type neuropeptides-like n=1 Tax=Danaus plexippus TaxID=13037 RepID=UPI002AAFD6E4|nr:PBAN-type neuropeptides-like [Danaus plexippus]
MGCIWYFLLSFTILLFTLHLIGASDMKDDNLDRGAHSDRGGVWFGPRLGKRSLQLLDDSNSQTFVRLLEAAEALKYYYDQMSYQMQADAPQKVIKKVIFTPKLGRALDQYSERMAGNIDFTPRLGRKLPERTPTTSSDEDSIQDAIAANRRPSYFSPRLGRNYNFSPRLGRELYELYPEERVRVARSVNGTNSK